MFLGKQEKHESPELSESSFSSNSKNVNTSSNGIVDSNKDDNANHNKSPQREKKNLKRKRDAEAAQIFGYSDENNPFNDPKLTTLFNDWDNTDASLEEHVEELQSLKQRRIQRQLEQKHLMEARLARERQELARLWGDSDDHFEWKQLLLKSEIRIKDNRASILDRVIDYSKLLLKDENLKEGACLSALLLGENVNSIDRSNMNASELKALRINDFLRGVTMNLISTSPPEIPNFSSLDITTLEKLLDEIKECLSIDYLPFKELWSSLKIIAEHYLNQKKNVNTGYSIDESMQQQIEELLEGKSYVELIQTEAEIREQLEDPDADVEYWESLLHQMGFYKAKALINHYFEKMKVYWDKYEKDRVENLKKNEKPSKPQPQKRSSHEIAQENAMKQSNEGCTASFTKEIDLNQADDKKLIKPQYYNRVILGFEWSKYNRVHFDAENPPPKQIQGYRFNIFYPLLDPNAPSPKYTVERSKKGFCVVRFHAGPPYADIGFQIVDKGEWDYRPSKGFRCEFHQGILSLWFKFKRHSKSNIQ